MKNKNKKIRKVNKENKVIDYRTYYLREFQLYDGEVDITFNIVAIDTVKEEITVEEEVTEEVAIKEEEETAEEKVEEKPKKKTTKKKTTKKEN